MQVYISIDYFARSLNHRPLNFPETRSKDPNMARLNRSSPHFQWWKNIVNTPLKHRNTCSHEIHLFYVRRCFRDGDYRHHLPIMVTICSIGSGYAGGSCSRKKNDRRKETRFKFLMVNGGGGNDGKRERDSVYGKRKKAFYKLCITETVRPRAECSLYIRRVAFIKALVGATFLLFTSHKDFCRNCYDDVECTWRLWTHGRACMSRYMET